jgi:hypothetical protein
MPPLSIMFQISRDSPAYYLTSVAHNRLPIFRTDEVKKVVADAFNEVRIWHRRALESEPLAMNIDKIKWRAAA